MKIVIVDDDQLVALSLKTILEANEEIQSSEPEMTERKRLPYMKERSRTSCLWTFR